MIEAYICEKFEKSIPKENIKKIVEEIQRFFNEYKLCNGNLNKMSNGYTIKKIKGTTNLHSVYKFYVNDSDRILFTTLNNQWSIKNSNDNSIVFLEYCNHDSQIRKARAMKNSHIEKINDTVNFDMSVDDMAKNITFNPEKSICRVLKNTELKELLQEESIKGLYYLNEEQEKCVRENITPLMIFGSAGSGKTTVGIYKLLSLIHNNARIGYFTYSKYLLDEAKSLFDVICKNEGINNATGNIDFISLKNYLITTAEVKSLKQYKDFCEWFNGITRNHKIKKLSNQISSFDLWKEIRGILKGFYGVNWIKEIPFNKAFFQVETIDFLNKINAIKERKDYFILTKQKHFILERISNVDKEFKNMILNDINTIFDELTKEMCNTDFLLDKSIYLGLSNKYSIFDLETRNLVYDTVLEYNKWLKSNKYSDENDAARISLEKILHNKIPQYDFIIVDEVQDLTEVEIYLIYSLIKEKKNLIFSGDYNQTVSPTYFDTTRIESLFKINHAITEFNKKVLLMNYRNSKDIVSIANRISEIRCGVLGNDKRNDYIEEPIRDNLNKPLLFNGKNTDKYLFLKKALEKHYVSIVVPDENDKKLLEEYLNVTNSIFTVSEIKGIEKKYIIAVNFLSRFSKSWKEVVETNNLQHSNKYRYLFNMFYVAVTRARDYICFIEDDLDYELFNKFIQDAVIINQFDEFKLGLCEESTEDAFFKEAIKLEKHELFEKAIQIYKKIHNAESTIAEKRCQALIYQRDGELISAGNLFIELGQIEDALGCYDLAKDYNQYVKTMLNYKVNSVIDDLKSNNKFDYFDIVYNIDQNEDIINKFENICLQYISSKLSDKINTTEEILSEFNKISLEIDKTTKLIENKFIKIGGS